jgi:membrane protein implicated in regulation of membrane protease activity
MSGSMASWWWWAAGAAVALELVTGTFYLLMIALGLAAGALAASAGALANTQIVVASLVGAGATALWHRSRMRHPHSAPAASNPDVYLDLGAEVQVPQWSASGVAQVQHRGSVWQARLAPGAVALPGPHTIAAIEGNHLVLAPLAPRT